MLHQFFYLERNLHSITTYVDQKRRTGEEQLKAEVHWEALRTKRADKKVKMDIGSMSNANLSGVVGKELSSHNSGDKFS